MATNCPPSKISAKVAAQKPAGKIPVEDIKQLIDNINNNDICESIQMQVDQAQDKVREQIDEMLAEAKNLAATFPTMLMKIPGFKKIPKWAKKLVTSTILPQIRAYIAMMQQAIELLQLLGDLMSAIQNAQTKLQNCVDNELSALGDFVADIDNPIVATYQSQVNSIITQIQDEINAAICDGASVTGDITALQELISQPLNNLASEVNQLVDNSLTDLGGLGSEVSSLTGIPFNVKTGSKEEFTQSIAQGADTQFSDSAQAFIELTPAVNTVAPTITGTAQVGETLTVNDGTWTGDGTITFTYQWFRGPTAIDGETNQTYVVTSADVGSTLTCVVDGDNDAGGEEIETAATAVVIANDPVIAGALSLLGLPVVGSTTVAVVGVTVNPGETASYQWKWYHVPFPITNATTDTYTPVAVDIGHQLICDVTITSATGSVTQTVGPSLAVT